MRLRWVRESYSFFAASGALMLLALLGLNLARQAWMRWFCAGVACLGLVLGIVGLIFFRDPERLSDAASDKILSAADGRVVAVEEVRESRYFEGPARRVAVFMNLGNVHVQRLPAAGKLLWVRHRPGKFKPAYFSSAARENEQRWYAFESSGRKFVVVQIAGLVARRTLAWIQPDRTYRRGERLGMIAFGSEVDTYWPLTVKIRVKPGDKVFAGQTVIGEWKE